MTPFGMSPDDALQRAVRDALGTWEGRDDDHDGLASHVVACLREGGWLP
jgi:hypothetical protein